MIDIKEAHEWALVVAHEQVSTKQIVGAYLRAMAEQGFELAPKEATEEMAIIGWTTVEQGPIKGCWGRMLAAAPKLELDND